MNMIKKVLISIWRIWFYVLVALPILLVFPILLITIALPNGYRCFFKIARIWAKIILLGMGFYYKIEKESIVDPKESLMIVANHTSMTDIMLMLVSVKNPFVFVGKKELVKIPVFGYFYRKTCILVDRGNAQSRLEVFKQANEKIKKGYSICIFPEGGVTMTEAEILDPFKDGAFRLAIAHQLRVLPLTFGDNKKRFPFSFFEGSIGRMRVKIHHAVSVTDFKDKKELSNHIWQIIYNQLSVYNRKA
jgi:1-acyl-sn-glycerol-3-phosphate acyltransferase